MPAPDDNDIHKIRFTGGPLDNPEEMKAAAELWRAIGLAACAWARLEQHLDAVLIHVNQPKHSEKLHDPDHPIGFKRKIKLLKRWFNQHPVLVLGDPCRPQGFLHPMHQRGFENFNPARNIRLSDICSRRCRD